MYDHDQNDHFDREKFMSCRVVSEQNTTDHDQVAFLVVVGADPSMAGIHPETNR